MSIVYNSSKTAETINRAIDNNMGTTTTEQGASSAGLIISEDLGYVVECTPGTDYKITEKTISGSPPLSFHAIAQHLIDWSVDGNTDSGDSVGDKTKNLIDLNTSVSGAIVGTPYTASTYGTMIPSQYSYTSDYIPLIPNTQYTFRCNNPNPLALSNRGYAFYDDNKQVIIFGENTIYEISDTSTVSMTTPGDCAYIRISWDINATNVMLNAGDAALPYEPYGYDVPIKVNNTDTYHCYITDVLRKSSGETPVYDTMSSDGTIIRRVDTDGTPLEDPITETYTAPDITVNWGWNTIDVDTTVTPSSMTINYKDD